MMASRSGGGGVELCGSVGRQVLVKLGNRRLVVALVLVVISTIIVDEVHCITPTPAPSGLNFFSFNSEDADALIAMYKNWSALNPQLTTILNWTSAPSPHPCNNSDLSFDTTHLREWGGVSCERTLLEKNATGNYYLVSVIGLGLIGSNVSSCSQLFSSRRCYNFTGIEGVLPPSISRLVNLEWIIISHNPKLTGPIPLEIWQMPKLKRLWLRNNSLVGSLPSHVPNASSTLTEVDLSSNNLSGGLQVSPNGTLFGLPNLYFLALTDNQLNGAFSTGPYFNPGELYLSNNNITSIKFENYTGPRNSNQALPEGSTVYMPALAALYVDNNKLSGPFPMEVMRMPSLNRLDLSVNNLSGSVKFFKESTHNISSIPSKTQYGYLNISFNSFNETFSTGPYFDVIRMDLSNNHFKSITFDTYNGTNDYMPLIEELYIQNNNLSGAFPSQILKAPSLRVLQGDHNQFETLHLLDNVTLENSTLLTIALTNNKLEDVQYPNIGLFTTYNLEFSNLLFLGGNPICKHIESRFLATICRLNRTSPVTDVIPKVDFNNRIIIGTCISAAFLLLMATLYVWKLMHRISSLRNILAEFEKKEVKPNLYSYKEIKSATKNFDKRNKLGEGGFGIVYKGELIDGTTIAVKKLTMSSSQGLSEFLNEVVVISGLKHRNLVKLKGCCLGDGDQRMLVFEYVENKNLGEALWMQEISKPSYLNWNTRFNIIIGTARGLAYLHEELQSPVIHRDIKVANILLDKNYNPKIADFGLAYLFPVLNTEESHLTLVEIAGTRGYCSPEYVLHGHISTALDVYSFGITILEVVSGRKNINLQKTGDEVYLREWAWRQFEGHALTMLIDPKMEHSSSDLEAITRVINVALACVQYKASKRPKMHDVVSMLLGNLPISNFSRDIEYEAFGDVASSSSITRSNLTSFIRENDNPNLDECSLLNNTHEIEMSAKSG